LEIGEKIATFAEAKAKRGGAKKEKRTETINIYKEFTYEKRRKNRLQI
jgi:hypothetical protein